jgi:DNA-binding protein HU-beta
MESVMEAVTGGDKVVLVGFGSFDVLHRSASEGFNPKTRAKIKIPASKRPRFKYGKLFRDMVNGQKKK